MLAVAGCFVFAGSADAVTTEYQDGYDLGAADAAGGLAWATSYAPVATWTDTQCMDYTTGYVYGYLGINGLLADEYAAGLAAGTAAGYADGYTTGYDIGLDDGTTTTTVIKNVSSGNELLYGALAIVFGVMLVVFSVILFLAFKKSNADGRKLL